MKIKILENKWVKFFIELYIKTSLLITGIIVYNTFNNIPLEFKSGAISSLKVAINESNDVLAALSAIIHLIWDALSFVFVLFLGQERSKSLVYGMLTLSVVLILIQKLQKKILNMLTTTTKKTSKFLSRKTEAQLVKKIFKEIREILSKVDEELLTMEYVRRRVRQLLAHKYYKYMKNDAYPSFISSQVFLEKFEKELNKLVEGYREVILHGTGKGLDIISNVIDKR